MSAREHPLPGNMLAFAEMLLDSESEKTTKCQPVEMLDDANVVTSIDNRDFASPERLHRPVLDIDFPVKVIPSSTPGHNHLYIDRPMTWAQYAKLLDALAEAGIIEKGYAKASLTRRFTAVRLPWIKKDTSAQSHLAPYERPVF